MKFQNTELMTRNEVAQLMGVTLQTLWRWNKSGVLKNFKKGSRVVYRRTDVENFWCDIRQN